MLEKFKELYHYELKDINACTKLYAENKALNIKYEYWVSLPNHAMNEDDFLTVQNYLIIIAETNMRFFEHDPKDSRIDKDYQKISTEYFFQKYHSTIHYPEWFVKKALNTKTKLKFEDWILSNKMKDDLLDVIKYNMNVMEKPKYSYEYLSSRQNMEYVEYRIGSMDNIRLFSYLYDMYLELCDKSTKKELIPNKQYYLEYSPQHWRIMMCKEQISKTKYKMQINDSGAVPWSDNMVEIDINDFALIEER